MVKVSFYTDFYFYFRFQTNYSCCCLPLNLRSYAQLNYGNSLSFKALKKFSSKSVTCSWLIFLTNWISDIASSCFLLQFQFVTGACLDFSTDRSPGLPSTFLSDSFHQSSNRPASAAFLFDPDITGGRSMGLPVTDSIHVVENLLMKIPTH